MLSLDSLDPQRATELKGLLFDLDDTLLTGGALTVEAYTALFHLRQSGLVLLAVSGRPSGWGEVLVRICPIDGMVAENGSVAILRTPEGVRILDEASEAERASRRDQLKSLVATLAVRIPELLPAADVHLRRADTTFDVGESRQVAEDVIQQAQALARSHGARTVRSSVHLHVSFDRSDKASGALRALTALTACDPTIARWRYAYVGDSENDEPAFAAFQTSFAVANLRGRATVPPRYVTQHERGVGFVELASTLVRLRQPAHTTTV